MLYVGYFDFDDDDCDLAVSVDVDVCTVVQEVRYVVVPTTMHGMAKVGWKAEIWWEYEKEEDFAIHSFHSIIFKLPYRIDALL